ncbi:MAG: PilX N-terminal domain-containing pilus assembly protein [Steroidobacteraceae bacterium]
MIRPRHFPALSQRRHQAGVALFVALVMLLIITVLGLASMRTTTLQERMSANMYDRSVAFQRSEAALRAAEEAITANWRIANLGGTDCSPDTGIACPLTPENAFITGSVAMNATWPWTNVGATHNVNSLLFPAGTPQYHIDFLGTGPSENSYGVQDNADYANYGNSYAPDDVAYYRVTTRSSSPANATDRAMVVLQSTYRRAF